MRDLEFENGFHGPIATIGYFLSLTPDEQADAMAAADEEFRRMERERDPLRSSKRKRWLEHLRKAWQSRKF
jgi:hypothetical protein